MTAINDFIETSKSILTFFEFNSFTLSELNSKVTYEVTQDYINSLIEYGFIKSVPYQLNKYKLILDPYNKFITVENIILLHQIKELETELMFSDLNLKYDVLMDKMKNLTRQLLENTKLEE